MTTILVRLVSRILLLPAMMIAIAILIKGYARVGDGFSAGVVAAMAILFQYLSLGYEEIERTLPVRRIHILAPLGLGIVLLVAFIPIIFGYPALTHFPRPGEEVFHFSALEFHTAFLFDLGIFLLVFSFSLTTVRYLFEMKHRWVE